MESALRWVITAVALAGAVVAGRIATSPGLGAPAAQEEATASRAVPPTPDTECRVLGDIPECD